MTIYGRQVKCTEIHSVPAVEGFLYVFVLVSLVSDPQPPLKSVPTYTEGLEPLCKTALPQPHGKSVGAAGAQHC